MLDLNAIEHRLLNANVSDSARCAFVEHAEADVAALLAEVKRLRDMTSVTMGVGDGSGQLFVHGSYESIKAAQRLVFGAEAEGRARSLIAKWRRNAISRCEDDDAYCARAECADELEEALRERG